jgi:acyl-CoA dehydrogenase
MTPRFAHLNWPFFGAHRKLALDADAWARDALGDWVHDADADAVCRRLVGAMGSAGWLRYAVGSGEGGDLRALCLLREVFAYHGGLPDFAFAMQGLGTRSIALCGSEALKARYLPEAAAGRSIAAFALSEPDAGSDVGALSAHARRDGDYYVLDGVKTWISNGGIADFYVVFARTDEAISAFVVDATSDGLDASQRIDIIAPHPMATLRFTQCRVPAANVLGAPGEGFKVAMRTLDVFRTTVAAAALGLARRALDEALAQRVTTEASMAKMFATEAAQQVVDSAVQLLGGLGVVHGHPVERLYREVRSLRIYEGATEVQKLIIARQLLRGAAA